MNNNILDELDIESPALVKKAKKMPSTLPNPANGVQHHLAKLGLGVLNGLEGVYITGSQVYNQSDFADVDIIVTCEGNDYKAHGDKSFVDYRIEAVRSALQLEALNIHTMPSMIEDREKALVPGMKFVYQSPTGQRVVDIWGMTDIFTALAEYPTETHGDARWAWSCEHGTLLMQPNNSPGVQ